MDGNNRSSISQADTLYGIGEFWDTHDFTEFDDPNLPDAEFTFTRAVPIEIELLVSLQREAHQRGVKVETMVNLWLRQKLAEQSQAA